MTTLVATRKFDLGKFALKGGSQLQFTQTRVEYRGAGLFQDRELSKRDTQGFQLIVVGVDPGDPGKLRKMAIGEFDPEELVNWAGDLGSDLRTLWAARQNCKTEANESVWVVEEPKSGIVSKPRPRLVLELDADGYTYGFWDGQEEVHLFEDESEFLRFEGVLSRLTAPPPTH